MARRWRQSEGTFDSAMGAGAGRESYKVRSAFTKKHVENITKEKNRITASNSTIRFRNTVKRNLYTSSADVTSVDVLLPSSFPHPFRYERRGDGPRRCAHRFLLTTASRFRPLSTRPERQCERHPLEVLLSGIYVPVHALQEGSIQHMLHSPTTPCAVPCGASVSPFDLKKGWLSASSAEILLEASKDISFLTRSTSSSISASFAGATRVNSSLRQLSLSTAFLLSAVVCPSIGQLRILLSKKPFVC